MTARSIIAALMAADRKGGLSAEAHETIRNAIAFLQVREAFGPNEREARQDRLYDSAYAAGLKAGWNLAQEDDEDGLNRAIEQRVIGHSASIEAARAEDKAREDAQPVESYGQKGKRLYDAFWSRNGGNAPSWEGQARAIRVMWMNIARDADTHPAPDALRVAVEALEEISEVAQITRARHIARHALAALQAEQGAK